MAPRLNLAGRDQPREPANSLLALKRGSCRHTSGHSVWDASSHPEVFGLERLAIVRKLLDHELPDSFLSNPGRSRAQDNYQRLLDVRIETSRSPTASTSAPTIGCWSRSHVFAQRLTTTTGPWAPPPKDHNARLDHSSKRRNKLPCNPGDRSAQRLATSFSETDLGWHLQRRRRMICDSFVRSARAREIFGSPAACDHTDRVRSRSSAGCHCHQVD